MKTEIEIRECSTLEELAACVDLQREVFALPEIEISPVRHFVVTKNAGGFALGAFSGDQLVGFVLSVPAFLRGEKAFYSHMTAVRASFQGSGVGARLKWAQRDRALLEGVKFIKWTFEPVKARNAFFNLEKLGAIVTEYQDNFYGTDYSTSPDQKIGLASDRLFAEWHLESDKVAALAAGKNFRDEAEPAMRIAIPVNWSEVVNRAAEKALDAQLGIREKFHSAFGRGLVGRGFIRDSSSPCYLLYED
ncbi:MAG TPA: GNAT family N-acetyltransferase [Pyrinomonadaceae bacterium]|nr:GNAT family N-acetyltransferase [Pyrinomonadaceae bacterium]